MTSPPTLPPRLGLFDTTAIVAGSMIGSAIFIAPSIMAANVGSPGILLALWVGAGVFTFLGALCYAELASMMPHAGGQYVYLTETFGRFWGFLYGWTLFLVIQTGFNAAVAIAFAKYLGVFVPGIAEANVAISLAPSDWIAGVFDCVGVEGVRLEVNTAQLAACVVIVLLTAVNALGVRAGATVQNIFTVLKVAALACVIVAGLPRAAEHLDHFTPLWQLPAGAGFAAIAGGLAVAMSEALFAYDAWNSGTFVAEEVRRPRLTVPRALLLGTVAVTLVYVLTNVAYLAVLPMDALGAAKEHRVAEPVAVALFGPIGSTLLAVAVLVSTFGCLNGLILSGARVSYAMARQRLFLRSCASLHPKTHVPVVALVVQGMWSCVLVFFGSYSGLLTFTEVASVLFGALTVAAVYRLRRTQPDRQRPFRCWGYPATPGLYLALAVPFLIYVVAGYPRATLAGLALVLSGVPVYFLWRRRAGR